MALTTCAVLLGLTMSGVTPAVVPTTATVAGQAVQIARTQSIRDAVARTQPIERWQVDRAETRPAALPVMYAVLGALQAADVYSTRRALDAGSREANPLVRSASRNAGAMMAAKALSSAATIYFAERAWKNNRKGAIVLMAAINGMTAAITAHNLRNAR